MSAWDDIAHTPEGRNLTVRAALLTVAAAAVLLAGCTHGPTVTVDGRAQAPAGRLPYSTQPPRPANITVDAAEKALLDASAVHDIFSGTVTFPTEEYMDRIADTVSDTPECVAVFAPPLRLYDDLHAVGTRIVEVKADGPNAPQVYQTVVVLPSEAAAQDAARRVVGSWNRCSLRTVVVDDSNGRSVKVVSYPPSKDSDTPTVSWKMTDNPWWGCQHAVGYRINVVVDVSVCGQPSYTFARQIALRIEGNLPAQ